MSFSSLSISSEVEVPEVRQLGGCESRISIAQSVSPEALVILTRELCS